MMKLSTLYLRAARRVARYEADPDPVHPSCCDALLTATPVGQVALHGLAYKHFADWFGQPTRPVYWFGKTYVYPHMTPENYAKKWDECKANQQSRIYALLLMWAMARDGTIN
jgi:hypothetical protein